MTRQPAAKVHIPEFMPFFWLGTAALVGPVAASYLRLPWHIWIGAVLAALLGAFLQARSRPRIQLQPRLPSLLVAASFCLAACLYQLSLPGSGPDGVPYYLNREDLAMRGLVIKPPEQHNSHLTLTVTLDAIEGPGIARRERPVAGKILVEVPLGSQYHYGDVIMVWGELTAPEDFGSFSYRAWLEHHGVYAVARYARVETLATGEGSPILGSIFQLRDRAIETTSQIFPAPESALLRGILLGDQSGLSRELKQAYSLTGTAHIIAISGFNMTILASIVTHLLTKRFGPRLGGLVTILVLAGYSILVGASASVVRAAIMSSYVLLGNALFRRGNLLNSLGLCVLLMVWIDPHIAWDIGFQMSAMATLGLVLFAEPARERLRARLEVRFGAETAQKLAGVIGDYVLLTLIAQAMVLPLIIWHFRETSWLFLAANPLILPVQPPLMILSLTALTGGLVSPRLGRLLAWLAWPFSAYTNRVVLFLAGLFPGVWVFPAFSAFWLILYYGLILALTLQLDFPKLISSLLRPAWALTGLTCLALLVWSAVEARPDNKLTLRAMRGTSGSTILITSPGGGRVLVSGPMDGSTLLQEVSQALSPFDRELDFVLIPRCEKKTLAGLFGLTSAIRVGQVLWGCDPAQLQTSRNLFETFEGAGVAQSVLRTGDTLTLGSSGLLELGLEENSLNQIRVRFHELNAVLSFGGNTQACDLAAANLYIGASLPESDPITCARQTNPILILEGDGPGKEIFSSYEPVRLANFQWIEISSDGVSLSLRGKK